MRIDTRKLIVSIGIFLCGLLLGGLAVFAVDTYRIEKTKSLAKDIVFYSSEVWVSQSQMLEDYKNNYGLLMNCLSQGKICDMTNSTKAMDTGKQDYTKWDKTRQKAIDELLPLLKQSDSLK